MDTTVILAQPRVSRLRAAVGYVDRRATGIAGPSAEIDTLSQKFVRGIYLFFALILACLPRNMNKYRSKMTVFRESI